MSFITKVVNFFKTVGAKVSGFFVAVFGSEAAHAFGDAALGVLKSALGVIAQDAVSAVESLALDSASKREEAFKRVVTDAQKQGLQFSTSLVNLLIELAVQRLKKNIAPLTD